MKFKVIITVLFILLLFVLYNIYNKDSSVSKEGFQIPEKRPLPWDDPTHERGGGAVAGGVFFYIKLVGDINGWVINKVNMDRISYSPRNPVTLDNKILVPGWNLGDNDEAVNAILDSNYAPDILLEKDLNENGTPHGNPNPTYFLKKVKKFVFGLELNHPLNLQNGNKGKLL